MKIHSLAALLAVLALVTSACSAAPTATPTTAATPPAATPEPEPATPEPEPATPEPEPATPEPGTPEPTATAGEPTPPPDGEEAELRWYCCLGTGEAPEQVPVEEQVAADFSESNPDANLTIEVTTYAQAFDVLSTQIQGGNPPDIIGPAGVGGLEAFHGQWLDLQPLIDSTGFDVTQFDQGSIDFYNQEGQGQIGLPFAVYPSMLWYVPSLFDEAGLEYPPHVYGEPYVMPDGTEVEWNYDTVKQIALLLTVDASGNDATSPDFDPDAIEQYGFEPQRDDLRGNGAYFGAGSLVAEDGVTARVPDAWRDAWKFWYDGMWNDNFILTGPIFAEGRWSTDVGGYAFFSGNVAMSTNFLWTTYGVGEGSGVEADWDLAAIPSHNGTVTSPLNADTFTIHKDTAHPEEAFAAYTYLLGEAAPTLQDLYGAVPARTADLDAFFTRQDETFTHGVDWQVAKDSLAYADNPNFEAFMPAYQETLSVLETYETKWAATPDLDMDAEIAALEAQIQGVWDAAQ